MILEKHSHANGITFNGNYTEEEGTAQASAINK